jgi:WD40 repeat protein/tRNA A-37 threonylcarbamoyl transferase component Bud32
MSERDPMDVNIDPALEELLAQCDRALSEGIPAEPVERRIAERFGSDGLDFVATLKALHGAGAHREGALSFQHDTWTLSERSTRTDKSIDDDANRRFGRFELLERIGSGGSGVVFRARDPKLGRLVALKVARAETLFSMEARQRFLREARVLAALRHPNIIPVYDAGEANGLPYIVQELCQGPNLAAWLREELAAGRTVPIPVATGWTVSMAQAVAHAHEMGIVHRDLKPSNVLLEPIVTPTALGSGADSVGGNHVPKITDFGIAKLFDSDDAVTATVAVLGTAAYMAPEQAEGKTREVGEPADVYSLGVILYELLTGRRPIEGQTDVDTLRRLATDLPRPVSEFRDGVPRDLQAICLKCLEKDPSERYRTAHELSADLERFISGGPVAARPVGLVRRATKAYRRQRRLIRVVLLASAVVIATMLFLIRRIASVSVPKVDAEAQYTADIRASFSIWNENDDRIHDNPNAANDMAALLARDIPAKEQVDRRGFDWHYLWRLCHPAEVVGTLPQIASWQAHTGDAYFVTFSRDGSRLASAGRDRTARVWDGMTGHPICVCSGHSGDVNCVDFSPDGELLATASEDHTVKVWDARTGKQKFTLVGHAAEVVAAVFSADGKTLISGDHMGILKQWDLASKRESRSIVAHASRINSLFLAADGHLLLSAGGDDRVRLWTMPELQLQGTQETIAAQSATVSTDGEMIAVGGIQMLNVYDVRTGGLRSTFSDRSSRIESVRFSPDGRQVAVCGGEGGLTLWDRCTQQAWPAAPPRMRNSETGQQVPVGLWCVTYSPDGRRLAVSGRDGVIGIWDTSVTPQWTVLTNAPSDTYFGGIAFSPDGARLAIASSLETPAADVGFRIWDVSSAWPLLRQQVQDPEAHRVRYSPDGSSLAVGRDRTVDIYDALATKRRSRLTLPSDRKISQLEFESSGSLIIVSQRLHSPKTTIQVYDVKSGKEIRTIGAPFDCSDWAQAPRMTFSARWNVCAIRHSSGVPAMEIHDLLSGRQSSITFGPREGVGEPAVSPSEPLLAVPIGQRISFWDIAPLHEAGSWPGITAGAMEFSADGRLLIVVATRERNVQLWDLRRKELLLTLPIPREVATHATHWLLAVSPDGKKLACSARNDGGIGGVYLFSGLAVEPGALAKHN